jgi:putative membrane protein
MKYLSLVAFGYFLLYFGLGTLLLFVFAQLYMFTTPYNEVEDIRMGKKAPAIALSGAMLGFTLPLLAMSYVGADHIDFLVWSTVAMVVQLVVFKVLYMVLPWKSDVDNQSAAILFAGASVCVGAINAFSLIPH